MLDDRERRPVLLLVVLVVPERCSGRVEDGRFERQRLYDEREVRRVRERVEELVGCSGRVEDDVLVEQALRCAGARRVDFAEASERVDLNEPRRTVERRQEDVLDELGRQSTESHPCSGLARQR